MSGWIDQQLIARLTKAGMPSALSKASDIATRIELEQALFDGASREGAEACDLTRPDRTAPRLRVTRGLDDGYRPLVNVPNCSPTSAYAARAGALMMTCTWSCMRRTLFWFGAMGVPAERITKTPVHDLSPWFGPSNAVDERLKKAADRLSRLHYLPPAFAGEPSSMRWERWLDNVFGSVSEGGDAIAALARRLDRPDNRLVILRSARNWQEERLPTVERPWLTRFWRRWLVVGADGEEERPGPRDGSPHDTPGIGHRTLRFIDLGDHDVDFEIDADFFLPIEAAQVKWARARATT